jgi:hypothetical protein
MTSSKVVYFSRCERSIRFSLTKNNVKKKGEKEGG